MSVMGNSNFYRVFRFGEQDAEAERFQEKMGWHRIWWKPFEVSFQGDWFVYRNRSDLPELLREYARLAEQFGGSCRFYELPNSPLRGTAAYLFYAASLGEIFHRSDIQKVQDILRSDAEQKDFEALYLEILDSKYSPKFRYEKGHDNYLSAKLMFMSEDIYGYTPGLSSLEYDDRHAFFRLERCGSDVIFSAGKLYGPALVEQRIPYEKFLNMNFTELDAIKDDLRDKVGRMFDASISHEGSLSSAAIVGAKHELTAGDKDKMYSVSGQAAINVVDYSPLSVDELVARATVDSNAVQDGLAEKEFGSPCGQSPLSLELRG